MRALQPRAQQFMDLFAGQTGSRSGPGYPIRWGERWIALVEQRLGLGNAQKDKGLTRQRAALIDTCMEHGRFEGVQIC